eukprot:1465527-Prymnesium_polylepis.1
MARVRMAAGVVRRVMSQRLGAIGGAVRGGPGGGVEGGCGGRVRPTETFHYSAPTWVCVSANSMGGAV